MHLCDAGLSFINDALTNEPQYLFIDWFGTSWNTIDFNLLSIYLDTILHKCIKINCIPIFLITDRTDIENRLQFINLVEQYTNKYNVHLIKIINCENRDKIL